MFFLKLMMVVTVIFWTSAIVAEAILASNAERRLSAGVRVGFGYLIILLWFYSAWKFMPMPWAWALGAALLAALALAAGTGEITRRLKESARSYGMAFIFCLAGANLFILPLHISGNYGPFTEGGGDVSVYSETSQYLIRHGLPGYGVSDVIYDLNRLIKNPTAGLDGNAESWAAFDRKAGNPPEAEHSGYRVSKAQIYCPLQFSPFAQWFFLAGSSNYHIFYGVMAFQYACLLLAIWSFFIPYGRVPATLGVFLTASSHGLISVSYNVYYLQATCLMISALMLAAYNRIRLFSWGGFRVYGPSVALVCVSYLHYIAVIAPLLAAVAVRDFFFDGKTDPETEGKVERPLGAMRLPRGAAIMAFTLISIASMAPDLWVSVNVYLPLLKAALKSTAGITELNPYLGDIKNPFSTQWLSFVYGALSQQHFPPFVNQASEIEKSVTVSVWIGSFALIAGALAWVPVFLGGSGEKRAGSTENIAFVMYIAAAGSVIAHIMITQASLYTQAKGAQNVLVMFYAAAVLPFAALYVFKPENKAGKLLKTITGFALTSFGMALLALHLAFDIKMAYEKDRAAIMIPSFFSEAERIMEADKDAFVWFEPGKNSHVYLYAQPFFGARIVPTRHLILQVLYVKNKPGEPFGGFELERDHIPSDFLQADSLSHFWVLRANVVERRMLLPWKKYKDYEWKAEKLSEGRKPRLLYSGYDYEEKYGQRPRSSDQNDTGWFTYVRNGAPMIYLPPGGPYTVEVRIEPRSENDQGKMAAEVKERINRKEFSNINSSHADGRFMVIEYKFDRDDKPRLAPLARYSGEFWFNARLNGAELY